MRSLIQAFWALMVFLITASSVFAQSANELPKLNQVGFYPEAPKIAITPQVEADRFFVLETNDSTVVFEGDLIDGGTNEPSGEDVKIADFSDFDTPGRYVLQVEGGATSYPFHIGDNVFEEVTNAVLKALYYNRASIKLEAEFAGRWSRPAGHPDNEVRVHNSAATDEIPANTLISSPGGWYDAGDFNKYIVPISMSIYQMLFAYEQFPEFFEGQNLNIPESNNQIADVLDESLYALRWMLTMQDPNDGGVYHKLTTTGFSGDVMPHQATAQRYVVQKSTAATLDFAAVMAQAARVYQPVLPAFSDSALAAAEHAWEWAKEHPEVYYNQSELSNPAISTGEYGDGDVSDEWFWASSELFITTSEDSLYDKAGWNEEDIGNPGWSDVRALGLYSLIQHRKNLPDTALTDTSAMKQKLENSFSWYADDAENAPYRSAAGMQNWQFYWGSNGGFGNLGMAFLQLYQLTGGQKYYDAAIHVMDYLLGRNPLAQSYITGHGDNAPRNIHHRQSEADGIRDPVPGWVAGGANPQNQSDDCGTSAYSSDLPALSYLDRWCSYSTNEITTYWNSPMIYVFSGLQALTPETGKTVGTVSAGNEMPDRVTLHQNYPNPFNPSTVIRYQLSENRNVSLKVFDVAGREVAELVNTRQAAGTHSVRFDASNLSTGVYFYRLTAGDFSSTQKMLLIK